MRKTFSIVFVASVVGLGGFAALAALASCVGEDADATSSSGSSSGATSSGGSSGGSSGASSSGASSSGASSSGASSSGGSSSGASSGGDAGDAGDASAPFNVRSLTGLKLWLESTKELTIGSSGGTPFGRWADQSGVWDAGGAGAPDGGRHIAYPFNVNPPSFEANGINGRPTVSFTDGNGWISVANHPDFQFGVGDWIIVEVAKVVSGTGLLWELRPQATAGSEEQVFKSHVCVSYGIGVTNGCTSPTTFVPAAGSAHVFVARRKGDVFSLRVDGATQSMVDRTGTTTNIGINEFSQPLAFIGKNLDALVSEVIIVVGPTDDAMLGTLENHLKAKYGTP